MFKKRQKREESSFMMIHVSELFIFKKTVKAFFTELKNGERKKNTSIQIFKIT